MVNLKELSEQLHGLTLLYVEDDPIIRMATMDIFEDIFDDIIVTCNGEEALSMYNKSKVDIIITDVSMPKINGIELINEIRKDDREVKIFIFSAYKDNEVINSTEFIDGYLDKPFNFNQLVEQLKIVLRQ